jgi:uncharacterized protein YhaN
MKLWTKSARVGNFGVWRDRTLPPLGPGLNLLYGPNEAGKTTLLQFLRAMLFGFDRQSVTLDGAEPGGALTLADGQGREWLLERWGKGKKARVTLSGASGASTGEAGLRDLLQNVGRPVYVNVFAFSLAELSDLRSLDHQEVRELLYSASLGLGSISLTKVESTLRKETEDLFKPGSRAQKKPEINQVLAELAQVRQTLAELEKQPEEYQDLVAELARLEQEIKGLATRRAAAEAERLRLQKLDQAWPVWENWQEVQADLAALPMVDTFPENGLIRLEGLIAEQEQAENERGDSLRALNTAQRASQELSPDLRLLEQAPALEPLWEKRPLFEDRREELGRKEQELAAARARLDESLNNLGAGWQEECLDEFPLSLTWRQGVRERQQSLEDAHQNLRHLETLCQQQGGLHREREAACEQVRTAGLAGQSGWFSRWGLVLAGGIILGAAGVLAFLRLWPYAIWTATGAGAVWLLAVFFWLHLGSQFRRRLATLTGELDRAAETLNWVQAERDSAQAKLDGLAADWQESQAADGFPPELAPADALELAQEVERARGHLHSYRELAQERDSLARFLNEFAARLQGICRSLDLPEAPLDEVNSMLVRLKQELTHNQDIQAKKSLLESEVLPLIGKAEKNEEALKRLQGLIQELFQAAGVDNEEAFRQRAEVFQRREDLLAKSRHLSVQLRLLAGGETAWEDFHQTLAHSTQADLQAGLDRESRELSDLDARLAQAREDKGRLGARRDMLERTEELGQTLLAEQTLAARLQDLARRWTVLALSHFFLERGRRRFEAESQPLVLQETSRYFAELTEGRYIRVMAPLEDENLLVINRQDQHVPVERLSRGTVEQLYLALRLALIQAYHQKGVNLPLVLDDTLVNFDHRRARQAVRLLQEMSATHQLLLFTCHPHIVTLVSETLGPAAPPIINLEEAP